MIGVPINMPTAPDLVSNCLTNDLCRNKAHLLIRTQSPCPFAFLSFRDSLVLLGGYKTSRDVSISLNRLDIISRVYEHIDCCWKADQCAREEAIESDDDYNGGGTMS